MNFEALELHQSNISQVELFNEEELEAEIAEAESVVYNKRVPWNLILSAGMLTLCFVSICLAILTCILLKLNRRKDTYKLERGVRSHGTSIYFLITSDNFSGWHRHKSNEIFNWYSGGTIVFHLLNDNGYSTLEIGDIL